MHIPGGRPNYHSYLLRLRRADALAPWQASLQSTADGRTYHFADLDNLWAFLTIWLMTDEADDLPPSDDAPPA